MTAGTTNKQGSNNYINKCLVVNEVAKTLCLYINQIKTSAV